MSVLKRVVLIILLSSFYFSVFAQTPGGEIPLVTHGDFVLRGTVLVQYQGREKNVIVPDNLGITEIAEQTFSRGGIESIIIPEGVRILRARSFTHIYGLRSVTIPASLTTIEENVFAGFSQIQEIRVHPNNRNFIVENGVLYNASKTTIICVLPVKTGSFNIPNSVTSIASLAFDSSSLTSITIPSSITAIGNDAFSYCKDLSSIAIPSGVTAIGDYAFSLCYNLTSVTIPSSVTSIGRSAFSGCYELTSVNIPSGVISIGNYAFSGCSSLTSVMIPTSVTSIGEYAFYGYSGLAPITIPSSVTSIGKSAFPDAVMENNGYVMRFNVWQKRNAITVPQSMTITPGMAHNAVIESYIAQWYRISIPAGNELFTSYTESGIDTEMWLYNSEGGQIAYDDDSGSGNNAKINLNLSAGTYYLRVAGYGRASGPYSLHVSLGQ